MDKSNPNDQSPFGFSIRFYSFQQPPLTPTPPVRRGKDPDPRLCSDLQRMAELRPQVFREPELLEAVGEILTGRGAKTAIQSSGGREAPCVAQAAACAILNAALKV